MHEQNREHIPIFETEGEIVEKIVHGAELGQEDSRFPGAAIINLSYGSKSMMLAINTEKLAASTFIDTVPEGEHKQQETTFLYKAVRILLDRASAKLGKKIFYALRTENPNIQKWAETSGEEIFHWENRTEIPQVGYPILHVFETSIEPPKQSSKHSR